MWNKFRYHNRKLFRSIASFGHGRITILFLPHSGENVFRMQISPFLIGFFLSLLIALSFLYSLTLSLADPVESQKTDLMMVTKSDEAKVAYYIDQFRHFGELVSKSVPILVESKAIITGEVDNHLTSIEPKNWSKRISTNLQNIGKIHDSNFIIALDLDYLLNEYQDVKRFVDRTEDVISHLPTSWPVSGGYVTSLFGKRYNPFTQERSMHYGLDIADAVGAPIRAAGPGEIIFSGVSGQLGNVVRIRHRNGFITSYGHNNRNYVRQGQWVNRGDIIGEVGQSGYATGPHVHFVIDIGQQTFDPYPFLMMR